MNQTHWLRFENLCSGGVSKGRQQEDISPDGGVKSGAQAQLEGAKTNPICCLGGSRNNPPQQTRASWQHLSPNRKWTEPICWVHMEHGRRGFRVTDTGCNPTQTRTSELREVLRITHCYGSDRLERTHWKKRHVEKYVSEEIMSIFEEGRGDDRPAIFIMPEAPNSLHLFFFSELNFIQYIFQFLFNILVSNCRFSVKYDILGHNWDSFDKRNWPVS